MDIFEEGGRSGREERLGCGLFFYAVGYGVGVRVGGICVSQLIDIDWDLRLDDRSAQWKAKFGNLNPAILSFRQIPS